MKHIFITTLLAAGTLFSATATTNLTKEEAQARKARIMQNSGNVVNEQRLAQPLLSSVAKAPAGNTVTVNFSLANPDVYSIKLAVAIDKKTGACVYYADANSWGDAEIPVGTYDFLFWGEMEEEPYFYCMFGDEDVEVSEDRNYVVDFAQCTEMVKFESTLPDGSRGQMPLENYDTGEIVEEGNLNMGVYTLYVFVDNMLIDWIYGFMERGVFDDGWSFDNELSGDIFVNEGLSSLSLVQYRELLGDEEEQGMYYSSIAAIPARGGVYTNETSDYALVSNPIVLNNSDENEGRGSAAFYYQTIYNGQPIYMTSNWNTYNPYPQTDYYWVGSNDALVNLGIEFYPSPVVIGGYGYCFASGDDSALSILSDPIVNRNGNIEVLATQNTFDSVTSLDSYNSFSNWEGYRYWGANMWFSVSADQRKIADGNSVPVLVAEQCWYSQEVAEMYGIRSVLYHNYKGRNGEGRTVDFLDETVKISINEVEQDMSQIPSIHLLRIAPEDRYGIWDIEFINNNCYVNGEKGLNTTKIHFNDKGYDVCAPTVQMLQTLDSNDNVTDVFTSPNDGRLVIAGGDFVAQYDGYTGKEWFDMQDCYIKVECSVRGTEEWQEMECIENPDRFMMPGWGYYWEIALESLPIPSYDTAYDVRITLTDDSGNYQEQTLSPVFTILGTTGVAEIEAASADATYYNLQGVKIADPRAGSVCIERLDNGTTRKVMLTR